MATVYGNFSWNVNNPVAGSSFDVPCNTDNINYAVGTPSVSSVSIYSCTPSSGSASAAAGTYSVDRVASDGGNTLRWKVGVNVNLSSVTAGGNGTASGSGQVQVNYS
jgi:hypothetical protein